MDTKSSEGRLFTLDDGRKTEVFRHDLFEWIISDFENFEEDISKCLQYIRRSKYEAEKIRTAMQALFDGANLLLVLKKGDDLAGEGINDRAIFGVEIEQIRGAGVSHE